MTVRRRYAGAVLRERALARSEGHQEALEQLLEFIRSEDPSAEEIRGWAVLQVPHGCSPIADPFGGYLCVCGQASYSHIYGCMLTGIKG